LPIFGQTAEWSEGRSLDWHLLQYAPHQGVQRLVTDLNAFYRAEPALWDLDDEPAGFEWIDAQDADHNVLTYLRRDRSGRVVAVVVSFSGVPYDDYLLGLPRAGGWREALNTDAETYGGSGVGNLGRVVAEERPHHAQPASVRLRVPPLGALFLVPEDQPAWTG